MKRDGARSGSGKKSLKNGLDWGKSPLPGEPPQIERLRKALADTPFDPNLWAALGNELFLLGRYTEALETYEKAASLSPDSAPIQCNRGLILEKAGRISEAQESYQKAILIDPNLLEAHNNLGNVLLAQGRLTEAKDSYSKTLELKPDYAEALYNLANVLRSEGKVEEAVSCYQKAIAAQPELAACHLNLGAALQELGRLEEAVSSFRAAIFFAPETPEGYLALGNALRELGKAKQAIYHYQTALMLDPRSVPALISLVETLQSEKRDHEAVASLRRILAVAPDNEAAGYLLRALTGGSSPTAPAAYVEDLFDGLASRFDRHLQGNLHYRVPQELVGLVKDACPPPQMGWDVLDLGCGTGLVGEQIAPHARQLVGVDLSRRMLEKARAKGIYHRLEKADVVAMLKAEPPASYDVVTAADLFIYMGDMGEALGGVRRVLREGGLFAFSLERLDEEGTYKLTPTTRYAHSLRYVCDLALAAGFSVKRRVETTLRVEQGDPVAGYLVLLG